MDGLTLLNIFLSPFKARRSALCSFIFPVILFSLLRLVESFAVTLILLLPRSKSLFIKFDPIKPAPPVIKIGERVIMGNMIDIICALCGEKQQIKTLYPSTFNEKMISKSTYSARRFPDKIHYRIVKCQNCSLVFS